MIDTKKTTLVSLIQQHMNTPIFQRIQLFVQERTGTKLVAYTNDESVPLEEREKFLDELIGILEAKQFEKLPAAPAGQTAPAAAPTKAEAPKAEAPKPVPAAVIIDATPAKNGTHKAEPAVPTDPMAMILAGIQALQKPVEKPLHEDRIRQIVREEVATIFASFAKALEG